jgi:phenylacetate-coenzyme A ligase PaaK-like adenylate-forming protein
MFGGKDFIRVDRSTIHKDCPLMDKVSRENALITITMFKADKIKAHEALNKLGFTEKEGE